jgi:RNA polymerase sigma factor (TIGR02999 family)
MQFNELAFHETRKARSCSLGESILLGSSSVWVLPMSEVTRILSAIEEGDPHAAEQLLPLVSDELRRLAAQKLAQENPGQTLEATALVHEAYLRLVDVDKARYWNSRGHFFAAAAEAMRRILVENARRKSSLKRGGGRTRQELDEEKLEAPQVPDELIALDEALSQLAATDSKAAELVKLRYFVGLPLPQAAEVLGISPRTADFLWAFARAWLLRTIEGGEPEAPRGRGESR